MKKRLLIDAVGRIAFATLAWISVLILVGIFLMLASNGLRLIFHISPRELFSVKWNPSDYENPTFGIVSMVISTGLTTLLAMVVAIPIGVGAAICISEILSSNIRAWVKPMIEMLASIPSVVIGFLGIVIVGPAMAKLFHLSNGLNALNGALLLAVMSLPTIITVAEDAIHSVSRELKEGSYALGADKISTLKRIIIPNCYSGIIAAVVLGMGRAIGETMTVLMVTGNATTMPDSIFDPVRTLTATIAIEMGEVPFNSNHYFGLFACGLILFLITLTANIIAENLAQKLRRNEL